MDFVREKWFRQQLAITPIGRGLVMSAGTAKPKRTPVVFVQHPHKYVFKGGKERILFVVGKIDQCIRERVVCV